MLIEVVDTNVVDKGKYKQMKVAFRSNGKLSEKSIMSFGDQAGTFDVLSKATSGEMYEIKAQKNDKGFWDWVTASKSTGETMKSTGTGEGNKVPARTFETPEERAVRQRLIVRQSSLSNAIDLLTVGAKTAPTVDQVKEVAESFVDFVFEKKTGTQEIIDMEDDVPY